jgi:hypothetical protein
MIRLGQHRRPVQPINEVKDKMKLETPYKKRCGGIVRRASDFRLESGTVQVDTMLLIGYISEKYINQTHVIFKYDIRRSRQGAERMSGKVAEINAWNRRSVLSDEDLKAQTLLKAQSPQTRLDDILPEAFAYGQARLGPAPFRRPVDRRHRSASRTYRGNADRRRQDFDRHRSDLS